MTSETKNQAQSKSGDENTGAPAKKRPLLMSVVMIAVVLGGASGGFVIGPKLVAKMAAQEHETDTEAGAEADAEADAETHDAAHEEVTGKFLELENLLVNPAGSRGDRFLMVSVAFEVPDEEALEHLHEREIQIRDVVSATLEARSLDDLTYPGARDDLKTDLLEVVKPLCGGMEWVRVYLPRFVIQ